MSIEVHVRIRPGASQPVWSSAETVLYSTSNPNARYVYNKVHPNNSDNRTIFRGLEAMVHAGFDGKNVTFMAYGQTGSGKTHSMIGLDSDPGIVPRTAKLLLELKRLHPGTQLQAYYTEIYNESVKDLLEPLRGELALHDAPDGGVTFDKRTVVVESYQDFLQLQSAAERNRKYGVTNLNDHSSRSHIILTFEIIRPNRAMRSVINLVDLAGSESAARANTEGMSLREGGFINKSLLALGNVVDAIVDKRPYIPYRDAKLTRILRTCLGGSGITFILCCINPSADNFDQTVSTLRFTQRAMKIKNDPIVVLNMPPLFTHQFSEGAAQLIEGMQESSAAEYQRGLRDAFMYTNSTASSIVSTFQSQVGDSLHALANTQRLLIAHDHALGIDRIGALYNQLSELARQKGKNQDLAEEERKRQRDITDDLSERRARIQRLEGDLADRVAAADTQLAGWEYQLHEARQKQRSEVDVLFLAETARRRRIQYEWGVCIERIASTCVPAILRVIPPAPRGSDETLFTSNSADGGGGEVSKRGALAQLRRQLATARAELADLEVAHEMVRDDLRAGGGGGGDRSSRDTMLSSVGAAAAAADEAFLSHFDDVPTEEVGERVKRLEREERALQAQAKRAARRESWRSTRESLGRYNSRSPQTTTNLSRSRTPQPIPTAAASSADGGRYDDLHGSKVPPIRPSSANTNNGGGRPTVTDTYALDVRNALAVLDGLKRKLAPTSRSRSRTPVNRQKVVVKDDDDVTLLELYGTGRKARREDHAAGGGGASSSITHHHHQQLQQRGKENTYRPSPSTTTAAAAAHHHRATKPPTMLDLVEEDNEAFTYHTNKNNKNNNNSSSSLTPPQRRWDENNHATRQNVERALYTINSNSQSPLDRGRSHRN